MQVGGGGRFRRPHFLFVVGCGRCKPGTLFWGVALLTYFSPSILVCFMLALIRVVKSSLDLGCENCLLPLFIDFFPKSICVLLSPFVPYSFILRQRVQGGRMCMKRPSNQILYKVIKFILYLCRMHNLTISSHWSLTNGAITCLGCFCHHVRLAEGWFDYMQKCLTVVPIHSHFALHLPCVDSSCCMDWICYVGAAA